MRIRKLTLIIIGVENAGIPTGLQVGRTGGSTSLVRLALCNAGIKIAISKAMIAITTNNSISVKAFLFIAVFSFPA